MTGVVVFECYCCEVEGVKVNFQTLVFKYLSRIVHTSERAQANGYLFITPRGTLSSPKIYWFRTIMLLYNYLLETLSPRPLSLQLLIDI